MLVLAALVAVGAVSAADDVRPLGASGLVVQAPPIGAGSPRPTTIA